MKRFFIVLCIIANTDQKLCAWGPTLSLSKETIALIDQFPVHIGQEISNAIMTSQAAAQSTITHTYAQIKALPLIGLGCTSAFYALWLLHNNMQELYRHYKQRDTQQLKVYACYAAASAALLLSSLAIIAKSDGIIAALANI